MSETCALGAQISHMLKARDVDVIFGIPGVHNQEMYRGIEEAGLTHVLARHEQGAGFMADGYARATGRPGVAYVITGPGLCNIMTPMGQATSDSVPILVLSSCLNRADLGMGRGRLHEMSDQEGAAATVCDWSRTAMNAQSAYQLIDRALMEFQTKRAGAKHIQVPIEVLQAAAPAAPQAAPEGDLPTTSEAYVRQFCDLLAGATRPLFIFGGGSAAAADPARALLKATGAASFVSYAGRGVVDPQDPLAFDATLARPQSAEIIASADLVVVIGSHLSEVDLWRDKLGHTAPMIRVDIDPAVLSDQQGAPVLSILADAQDTLNRVVQSYDAPASTGWSQAEVAAARQRWRGETDAERPGIVPLCEALAAVLPEDVMVFSDMTQFAYVAKEVMPQNTPGSWHHPSGFGTLGYAVPAAIGGKVGRGADPVLAIIGDYGFQYTVQELATAVELGLSLPILLWDNGKLKEIEDSMRGAQIAPNAVVAQNPDFDLLAQAYGMGYVRPTTIAEFQEAIVAGFAAGGPTMIHMTPAVTD
ncbi:5-guanidino-2-oxopentanoate decarboxylase [Algirhabdus cladophorae]|uniref:5-guanidino-2-oxopentanoate decarboxylase n=1 Tax=Algirhabdus cladophorae TaxID=3377108 RepID=UPI003B8460F5